MGFLGPERGSSGAADARTVGVRTTDTDDEWVVRLGHDGALGARGTAVGDCVVRGPASDVYLFMWNRLDPSALDVEGDRSVLGIWRDTVKITWGSRRA